MLQKFSSAMQWLNMGKTTAITAFRSNDGRPIIRALNKGINSSRRRSATIALPLNKSLINKELHHARTI